MYMPAIGCYKLNFRYQNIIWIVIRYNFTFSNKFILNSRIIVLTLVNQKCLCVTEDEVSNKLMNLSNFAFSFMTAFSLWIWSIVIKLLCSACFIQNRIETNLVLINLQTMTIRPRVNVLNTSWRLINWKSSALLGCLNVILSKMFSVYKKTISLCDRYGVSYFIN